MLAFKGFNDDLTCQGFAYEVGKTYTHEGEISLCNSGFHAFEIPLDVLGYYPPTGRFAVVELDGVSEKKSYDSKRVSKTITVKAAINIAGLIQAQIEWVSKQAGANIASGDYSTAASSGDYSKAASSGYSSTAASSGDYSKAEANGKQTVAMVAGLDGRAKAGENGAFALSWKDGEQMRIAVGVVGENGIKANVWYRTNETGQLIEVQHEHAHPPRPLLARPRHPSGRDAPDVDRRLRPGLVSHDARADPDLGCAGRYDGTVARLRKESKP